MAKPLTQPIRIATRNSALALWQAEFVRAELERVHPQAQPELVPMTTKGDQWLSSPLSQVGGKGLFIKALEQAMLQGRADIAVHSAKDLPAELPDGFVLAAIGYRDDVADAFVCPGGYDLDSLPPGSLIGSASLRRQTLLRARRPDCRVEPVRGNVGTRLDKLDRGDFDALLLACTGLTRLGLADRISARLGLDWFVPAVGQGALAVECLADDLATRELLAPLNDPEAAQAVGAERALSAALGASCSTPLGGYARFIATDQLELRAVLGRLDGTQLLHAQATGADPRVLGIAVADQLQAQGAQDIMDEVARATATDS